MRLNLHANATTREYIQASTASVAELAAELGVHEKTIRRWRGRTTTTDRSHRPHRLATSLSPLEEALICELRSLVALPLDDITEAMRRCVNPKLSRSAIHRCLQRHGISRMPKPDTAKPGRFETATVGFIHIDLKHLPALERRKAYVFVAIDRTTRAVYIEIHPRRDAKTAAAFLERFLAQFPAKVHTILTDGANVYRERQALTMGSEFTDRFAVDMKGKPEGKPSGNHPFDTVCATAKIEHRLTKPFKPQTNGMVERFNRRIAEAIGRQTKRGSGHRLFANHADRDAFLNQYNHTRLKCLGYTAPLEALANLQGPNTGAGISTEFVAG